MRARAKVFTTGGSQAVRLPKQFRLDAREVEIWRVGEEIRIKPISDKDLWRQMFDRIDRLGFDVTIEDIRQPPMPAGSDIDLDVPDDER